MLSMSQMIKKLEDAGMDTSKFRLELNGIVLKPEELVEASCYVPKRYIKNEFDDLRTTAIEVLRAMSVSSTSVRGKKSQGYKAYVKNCISYNFMFYQLEKIAEKIYWAERKGIPCDVLKYFFPMDLFTDVADNYVSKLLKSDIDSNDIEKFLNIYDEVKFDNYEDIMLSYQKMLKVYRNLEFTTPKPQSWKDSWKGYQCFLTIQYLIETQPNKDLFGVGSMDDNLKYLYSKMDEFKECKYKFYDLVEEANQ